MPRIVIVSTMIIGGLLVWWCIAGSSVVRLIDLVTTTQVNTVAPTFAVFDEGEDATHEPPSFYLGDRSRAASAWRVMERPAGHLALESSGRSFALGRITRKQEKRGGKFEYEVRPDSGDLVSLTRRESRLSWPRLLDVNWLGRQSARWTRHVYFRLLWRKANGDVLDATWRDEKRFTSGGGWVDQYDRAEPTTRITSRGR